MAGVASGGERASPPLKMAAAQLGRRRRRRGVVVPGVSGGRAPPDPSVVWMQGTVVAVDAGARRALLRDDTGTFTVRGLDHVPHGKTQLAAGMYIMVMGVVESCCPEPCLQAVKMTDLSGNPLHKSMWGLEVEDLHNSIP
ncbi:recQ-mediated genome instability protein 2 [Tachyglossus aculeatus]|uniref:recQ-mediated genome instability protein 2 n=1 Tax=Tachyglossus aculeatus TaxID=9261 RepID=UPI0018F6D073|nr:recQ-mediated genome instability protein 2 [Tachyglossus aculeatus]